MATKETKSKESMTVSDRREPTGDVYEVGKAYLIRTVTHYWLGKVERVTPTELVLAQAGWVSDTGRYHVTLRDGLKKRGFEEFEPAPGAVIVGRGAIVDAAEWTHALPTAVIE